MLDHPNSISNNLVKRPFLGPINPNRVSYTSISAIEIFVSESINNTALYTSNASSESSRVVFTIYFFFLDVIVVELIIELNLLVLFSLFVVFP